MVLFLLLICIVGLVVLVAAFHINPFLSFLLISVLAGLLLGIPPVKIGQSIEKGIGDTLGSVVLVLCLGAMLGKLLATTGAARQIATSLQAVFKPSQIQWAMAASGFVVGIPLFYGIGFVLMMPIIFSVSAQLKRSPIFIGLPLLAALSVTHGYLPPHPSPSALVVQFHANMGLTLWYGILLAIPSIILAGPILSRFLKRIHSSPLPIFLESSHPGEILPSPAVSFTAALLPVLLIMATTFYPLVLHGSLPFQGFVAFIGQPSIALLLALAFASFALGPRLGYSMQRIMDIYTDAAKDIAMIVLIIGGSGALKQVLTDSGASHEIASLLKYVPLSPLMLAWSIAAVIRACLGSATVAGLTTAGIILPLMMETHSNPNLMVLAIGSGSLMFSHVNDSGFWMFKEYFNLSLGDTFRSWSVMEAVVSLTGLGGVLALNLLIK